MLSSQLVGGSSMKDGAVDGTVAGGGTIQWVLGNNGTVPWPKATTLRLVAGPVLACHSVEVPPIMPGQTAVIELEVSAVEATAEVSYVLVAPRGEAFGEILTVEVAPESTVPTAAPKPLVAVLSSPVECVEVVSSSTHRVEWTLANVGTVAWPTDACARLVYSSLGSGRLPLEVALPPVAPDQLLHLEVCGHMPSEVGNFKAMWAVSSAARPDFGELLLVEFEVVSGCSQAQPTLASDPDVGKVVSGHSRVEFEVASGSSVAAPSRTKLASSELRYNVEVSNKYAVLALDLPQEEFRTAAAAAVWKSTEGHAQQRGSQQRATSGGSLRQPLGRPLAPGSTKDPKTARRTPATWSRGRSPCYTAMSLLLALLLGPHVCFGGSAQRGVVGTCSGGVECTALLEASETRIFVEGAVATVELVQTFQGGMTDASFVLPIDAAAVVTNFSARVGGKLLRGSIQERKQAQRTYDEHVQAGCPAALAQQGAAKEQKPEDARDLFRISIGNVPANSLAQVNISLVQELDVEDAGGATTAVRLLVPTATPSRYGSNTGAAEAERALRESGWQLPKNFAIHAEVHGEVQSVTSPSHAGLVSLDPMLGEPSVVMSLVLSGDNVTQAACKTDFVLRLALGSAGVDGKSLLAPRAVLEEHPDFLTWVAMVELVPRFTFEPEAAVELLFLVDRSGSMGGPHSKIAAARRALQHFVRSSPVGALVNIVGFGFRFEALFPGGPRELHEAAFQEAITYADKLLPDFGGTDLREALTWLLTEQSPQEGRARRVFVLTDGEVWNPDETLRVVEQHCGAIAPGCQLSALGIGSGASTALVQGLARVGRGSARFVAEGEEGQLEEEVVQMLAVALQPSFSNVSVSWPSAGHYKGSVPLLSRRRLQAQDTAASDGARTEIADGPQPTAAVGHSPEGPAAAAGVGSEAGDSLFDESAEGPAAAVLSRSVGAAAAEEERRHAQDLERFVAQGGVLEGPLQAPQPAPPILVGQRWAAYAFLGRLRGGDLPGSLLLRARRNGKPVEVRALVARRTRGRRLHTLAARRLVETLEGNGQRDVKAVLPGEDDRRWQVAALGLAYGMATAQTSWLALSERVEPQADAETTTTTSAPSGFSVADSPPVFDLFGSAMALRLPPRAHANFHIGSSLAVRSCCRLGSTVASLESFHLGSSLAHRSFARLASSVALLGLSGRASAVGSFAVIDACALGSTLAVGSFGKLSSSPDSSLAVLSFARLGSDPSVSGSAAEVSSRVAAEKEPAPPPPPQARLVAFVGLDPPDVDVPALPLLPVWSEAGSGACVASETNLSSWSRGLLPVEARLELLAVRGSTPLAGGATPTGTPAAAAAAVAAAERLGISTECEILADGVAVARASLEVLTQARMPFRLPLGTARIANWHCTCPAAAYDPLVAAQRFDGSFAWPQAFLHSLGWANASVDEVLSPEALAVAPWLPSGLAVAALRRCFGGQRHKWGLIEQKALSLHSRLPLSETFIALAERLVLVQAMAVANARRVV